MAGHRCGWCNGSGYRRDDCRNCNGKGCNKCDNGKIRVECRYCRGTGEV